MKHDVNKYLEKMDIDHDDISTTLECYFCRESGNLWHVFVSQGTAGDLELYNVLSDTMIKALEREYEIACRAEAEEQKLSAALDRYYQKTGVIL